MPVQFFFSLSLPSLPPQAWQSIRSVYFITIWCVYIYIYNYLVYLYVTEMLPPLFMNFPMWTGVGHTLGNQSALKYIFFGVFTNLLCPYILHKSIALILQQCIAAMLLNRLY